MFNNLLPFSLAKDLPYFMYSGFTLLWRAIKEEVCPFPAKKRAWVHGPEVADSGNAAAWMFHQLSCHDKFDLFSSSSLRPSEMSSQKCQKVSSVRTITMYSLPYSKVSNDTHPQIVLYSSKTPQSSHIDLTDLSTLRHFNHDHMRWQSSTTSMYLPQLQIAPHRDWMLLSIRWLIKH